MAHILRLNQIDVSDGPVLRETKSRVWWTLIMADRWCSAGLNLPRQLTDDKRTIRLPVDEFYFQRMEPDFQGLSEPVGPGLWAHMITLVDIFTSVQDLNRRLVEEHVEVDILEQAVSQLAGAFDAWIESLPVHVRMTEANLDAHIEKGLGGPFVALHLGYHHYATLLFFQYLDLQRPITPNTEAYARRCKYHAHSLSTLLESSREKGKCDAVYATVGHMTVVSSSVLLHTLQFGEGDELAPARTRLNSNFVGLIELKTLWPSLARTVSHDASERRAQPVNKT